MCKYLTNLLSTKTARFIQKSDAPEGRKVAYLRIIVDIRDHKAIE